MTNFAVSVCYSIWKPQKELQLELLLAVVQEGLSALCD
jgi:hypothetical protein